MFLKSFISLLSFFVEIKSEQNESTLLLTLTQIHTKIERKKVNCNVVFVKVSNLCIKYLGLVTNKSSDNTPVWY